MTDVSTYQAQVNALMMKLQDKLLEDYVTDGSSTHTKVVKTALRNMDPQVADLLRRCLPKHLTAWKVMDMTHGKVTRQIRTDLRGIQVIQVLYHQSYSDYHGRREYWYVEGCEEIRGKHFPSLAKAVEACDSLLEQQYVLLDQTDANV